MFGPVVSALTGTHRDSLVLPLFAKQPEIQYLASRGQIVSVDPLLLTDGQTHNYNFSSMLKLLHSYNSLFQVTIHALL